MLIHIPEIHLWCDTCQYTFSEIHPKCFPEHLIPKHLLPKHLFPEHPFPEHLFPKPMEISILESD